MATTTPFYGWSVPTSTDLVKDGASAIETLGDSIDASMNTALGTKKAGMVLLNTTSFSGVSSQSFNDVFSTIYDNYRIILRTTAIDAQIFFRLRVAGADASGANYDRAQILGASGPTFNFSNSTGNTSAVFSGGGATDHTTTNAEIVSPFLAQQTLLTQNYYGDDNAMLLLGSRHTLATSYTGFTIFSTNNFTGTLSVYGYNK